MKLQEVMQAQIDSAISGLSRIRNKLPGASARDELAWIERDLEWVASHLQDIQHNWSSLHAAATPRLSKPAPCPAE